jgi:hypothetical protein
MIYIKNDTDLERVLHGHALLEAVEPLWVHVGRLLVVRLRVIEDGRMGDGWEMNMEGQFDGWGQDRWVCGLGPVGPVCGSLRSVLTSSWWPPPMWRTAVRRATARGGGSVDVERRDGVVSRRSVCRRA